MSLSEGRVLDAKDNTSRDAEKDFILVYNRGRNYSRSKMPRSIEKPE